jgi:hypothetical protein
MSTHFYQDGYVGDILHEGRKMFKVVVEKKDVFGIYRILGTTITTHPKTAMKWIRETITADNGGIMPEEIL